MTASTPPVATAAEPDGGGILSPAAVVHRRITQPPALPKRVSPGITAGRGQPVGRPHRLKEYRRPMKLLGCCGYISVATDEESS
jgi:hypothetical protein